MVRADDIRELRTAADDFEIADRLKRRFERLRASRRPFYLSGAELDEIFRWKLRGQYDRDRGKLARNTESVYQIITQAAFMVSDDQDPEYEAGVRLGILTALSGVGVPVASAVLALVDPNRYCVIDFRGWRAVFDEKRQTFSISDYRRYLPKVRELAGELNWSIQETDMAIWELDRQRNGDS